MLGQMPGHAGLLEAGFLGGWRLLALSMNHDDKERARPEALEQASTGPLLEPLESGAA